MNKRYKNASPWLLGFIFTLSCLPLWSQEGKIKIDNINDLPRHAYKADKPASEILQSKTDCEQLAKAVRQDIESDLQKFEIDDAATLKRYYSSLVSVDFLLEEFDRIPELLVKMRDLEDKPAARAMTGLVASSLIDARVETGESPDHEAFQKAFAERFKKRVFELPWDLVQDQIKAAKGRTEMMSPTFIAGMVQSQMDPIVAQQGELSAGSANALVSMRFVLDWMMPLKDETISIYQAFIDAHQVEKEDIWPERSFALSPDDKASDIVVAAWDSGVDTTVFQKSLFVNEKEIIDGIDNDGNGFVDDVNGIAFSADGVVSKKLLHPKGDMAGKVDQAQEFMKGYSDLQASIDSEDAAILKKHIASMKPEDVAGFIESLSFFGLYAHGTHVAGIMTAGNPFAKVLTARISFDYHTKPIAITKEIAHRHAKSYAEAVNYFKQNVVRVVNMSWGWTLAEIESSLEINGIGETPEKRGDLAAEVLDILRQGLKGAITDAPDILFVCAAGNDDSDVGFEATIPSSFDLDNLLIVGAVDQAGDPTSFTSFGKNVQVYANGFEVDSFVPGGARMEMSGTSMASPNAANLAGKLLALNPKLKPKEVIALIKKGADAVEGSHPYLLLNPKASRALLDQ